MSISQGGALLVADKDMEYELCPLYFGQVCQFDKGMVLFFDPWPPYDEEIYESLILMAALVNQAEL